MVVHNPEGSVLRSLDVSGPPYRLSEKEVILPLERTVEAIEAELVDGTASLEA